MDFIKSGRKNISQYKSNISQTGDHVCQLKYWSGLSHEELATMKLSSILESVVLRWKVKFEVYFPTWKVV